ncbi:hypothetical protein ACSBR1_039416 [Camellia fascicularis]
MTSSRRPLTLFPDLNNSLIEITICFEYQQSAPTPAPVLHFLALSVEQLMATQSEIDANHYTLKSCVETVIAVSNLSRQL